jgi:amino acid transporter
MSNNTSYTAKVKNFLRQKPWHDREFRKYSRRIMIWGIVFAIFGAIALISSDISFNGDAGGAMGFLLFAISLYLIGGAIGIQAADETLRKRSEKEAQNVNDNSNPQS